MWKSNPQCDSIWRWGLWEMIRSWGRNPHEWDHCLSKLDPREPLLQCEVIVRRALPDTLILDFQPPELKEMNFCFYKLPSLQYSVVAVWVNWGANIDEAYTPLLLEINLILISVRYYFSRLHFVPLLDQSGKSLALGTTLRPVRKVPCPGHYIITVI